MKPLSNYFELDTDAKVIDYIKNQPILKGKFANSDNLVVKDLADGNLNLVYAIIDQDDPGNKILIKQALPHLRVLKSWKLIKERLEYEAKYYSVCQDLGLDAIPEYYGYDHEMCVIMMEYLDDHIIYRKGITDGKEYPEAGKVTGKFLARMLYQTSDFHQAYKDKLKETIRFANPHLCILTHMAIFTNPYLGDDEGNIPMREKPPFYPQILEFREDQALKAGVMEMKYAFMNNAEALLHADLHSGSLMVNEDETRIIDPEFCFYGPMGFDLGLIIGSLFLSYTAQFGLISEICEREKYQNYLLKTVEEIWEYFANDFMDQWRAEADVLCTPVYRRNFMKKVLQDCAGFAGCKMIRRVARGTTLIDFLQIQDENKRTEAITLNMEVGRKLILKRDSFENITDLIRVCMESRPTYKA